MPNCWTDSEGQTHTLPPIDWTARCRLKEWGIVDLLAVINDPEQWESLFDRIASDGEFICNFAYALEHKEAGNEAQQLAFGNLLCGDDGSGPLLECSDALREAVIDFFPASRRDAIRQLYHLKVTQQAMATIQRLAPELDSDLSCDSPIPTNGPNPCSESSDTMATDSACDKFASGTTPSVTTTT